jgi:hypothetical protein
VPPLQVAADDAVSSFVLESDEYEAATKDRLLAAKEVVTKAADEAASKVRTAWGGL